MNNTRRKFLNFIIGGSLVGWIASALYPIFSFLKPPKIPEASINSIKAGIASEFASNSGKIVKFGRMPVLLIRTESDEFRAFAGTCTHLDCIVQYRDDSKRIWCACHNGFYDLKGRNLSGPPPKPLEEFTVEIINDEIIITKNLS